MSTLPDPPLHMKPGSPEFIQWVTQLKDYADYAIYSAGNTWGATYSIHEEACYISTTEQTINTASVQWESGTNYLVQYTASADAVYTPTNYTVAFRVKRDGTTLDTYSVSGVDAGRYMSWAINDAATDNNSHTYTVTAQLTAIVGYWPCLGYSALLVQSC